MNKLIKTAIQEATPPILFRCMQTVYRKLPFTRKEEDREEWGEKPPEWYDAVYAEISDYRYHYTKSKYYFLWAVIVDRMV
ncbi:MAG: hypothetical protein K9N48_06690, partial [Verrucomicrobia bacterium]|nr:hypothetical protein [Verrucomicrobiota bacterium]